VVDGARAIRQFFYITLPSIKPALLAVCCLIVVSALRAFDVIVALTQGGPVNATNVLLFSATRRPSSISNSGPGSHRLFRLLPRLHRSALLCPQHPGRAERMKSRRFPILVQALICWALIDVDLFPIYWMLISGFKTQSEIFANPPTFWPKNFSFDACDFVSRREDVLRYVRNSVYIAAPVTAIAITLAAIGSYALCRLRSRIVVILLLQVFPEVLLATPLFIIFKSLGLLNSYWAVILATSARLRTRAPALRGLFFRWRRLILDDLGQGALEVRSPPRLQNSPRCVEASKAASVRSNHRYYRQDAVVPAHGQWPQRIHVDFITMGRTVGQILRDLVCARRVTCRHSALVRRQPLVCATDHDISPAPYGSGRPGPVNLGTASIALETGEKLNGERHRLPCGKKVASIKTKLGGLLCDAVHSWQEVLPRLSLRPRSRRR
jgi:ABC-type glycerol-3-phosphate transport system permease component